MVMPKEIINLANQATSNHNDGWVKKQAKDKLKEIKEYIEGVLSQKV